MPNDEESKVQPNCETGNRCPYCNKDLTDGGRIFIPIRFCFNCGHRLL